ncbi:DctP family TRAP transporter solute-binding subunit [Halobacillus amylolyticus]|uniref:DctP family TRAP transporter solute-binding subunit n=2 Tax=Halobacillus amylolyticus TaxID=2932259 RepID=A0ABY4H981_9BACI|nr:DctP family TRAP transporter solute-binding subunit [Halobacillus amylolyticus]
METRTDGAVTIQVNHNAVLGSEADEIQQIRAGSLDGALFYGISNFQSIDPVFGVEELPFIFSGTEHARNAFDGEFGDEIASMLSEHQFEVLSFWENGFRHFTNNIRPIVEPADMEGIKFRSAEIPLRLKMFDLLDAVAIPMGFNELFTALQQGTVDGQENPLSTINSSKFYEVQDYLSLSGHIYNSAPLIISPQSLEKLSDEQQTILKELAEELKVEQRSKLDEQNQELETFLSEQGMEVNEINREAFLQEVQPLWETFAEENGEKVNELVELINKAE